MSAIKICARADLKRRAAGLAQPHVFTNGMFDLLHRGHIDYLCEARYLGCSLIVGIHSDASARALNKGAGRPLNNQADRAAVVAALECVSLVVVFDEPTLLTVLEELRPRVYVRGGPYSLDRPPEAERIGQWGGRTVVLNHRAGCSTTLLIDRARQTAVPERKDTVA
ncbi:adenylyltransferase/cytidyltransferase family protein [Hydrogenophaga sp. BPS33]|uniref:adenylyltransferase/cytidyltransferase family protein n=1 Tax=Hydrogenophaga sp. BPS33 TaxID=2651974 RepID=UPI00131F8EF6|nr:adenylyltransferase/cytidyltransferase family protein [Hydrogenophaga sp. BPS33]QHE86636.1 adenylyltransferase/cytidyltransferase family protein [Hydrogenophaga sp. BPS33]